VEFLALLSIGLTLIGYFFVVTGAAGLIAATAAFAFSNGGGTTLGWQTSAPSSARAVAGVVLIVLGRRAVQ